MLGNAKKVERAFRARGVCDTAVREPTELQFVGVVIPDIFSSMSQNSVLLSVLV